MTYIPRVGNHGLMVELKSEEAGCLEWEHIDPKTLPLDRREEREKFRPDAEGTCLCTPYTRSVPPGFSTQDGPYTENAENEIQAVMGMWGRQTSLEQRLAFYDECAEEERLDQDPIWVD
jgi:hypothetical protein